LERKAKVNSASPYTMATIYAGLGDNDKAFEFLERGYSEKSLDKSSLKSGLVPDSLRPDPRFQSLLRRMGLNNWTSRARRQVDLVIPLFYGCRGSANS
jgi:hypothetical protein